MLYGLVLVINLMLAFAIMRETQLLYCEPKDIDIIGIIRKKAWPPCFVHSIHAIAVIPNFLFAYQFLKLAAHDDSLLFAIVLGALCMMPSFVCAVYVLLKYYKASKSFWHIVHPILHFIGIALVIMALTQYKPYI